MNTKREIKCVHCGEHATKVVHELGVEIPLCLVHYRKYLDEEDVFIDNVVVLEEDET